MNRLLYNHTWMDLREDAHGEAFVDMAQAAVIIVAFTADRNVLFVREKSIAYQSEMLSLPMGGVEAGEYPAVAANRQLQEETGYRANDLEYVGTLHPSITYVRWECHVHLARDLVRSPLPGDETSPVVIAPISSKAISRCIASGQLRDAMAIAALHRVERHMKSRVRRDLARAPDMGIRRGV